MLPRVGSSLLLVGLLGAAPVRAEVAATPRAPAAPRWRGSLLPEQWRRAVPPSAALATPGLRERDVQPVTLREAIAIAVEHNPGIAARRLTPASQDGGVLGAQGRFDPSLESELNYGRSETPSASALTGTPVAIDSERYANFHLVKLLRTGTQVSVDFLNKRTDSNNGFATLRPYYTSQLGLSVVQPLLRGFGWDFSYLVVRVAEQTADAALHEYEAALADFVIEVIAAYWNVVRARDTVAVQRGFRAAAARTVEDNQARQHLGLLPPVAVLEAQADAALREQALIAAENDHVVARQRLAALAYYRPAGNTLPRLLEPVEDAEPEDCPVDAEQALDLALASRPELQASANRVAAQQLNERIAGNAVLPRIDAVGTVGYNGLAGDQHCVTLAGKTFCSPFAGKAAETYDRMDDFRSYAVGLRIQVPIANAASESAFVQSRIAREQAELNHRELVSQVTLEVSESASTLTAGRQRIAASRLAVRLAAENLRNQDQRHAMGLATTKDLLDFQTRLRNAQAAEVEARTDHAIAVARWRRAQATLLRTYQIVVVQPGRRSTPWFARF